jgi:hypothetical protein
MDTRELAANVKRISCFKLNFDRFFQTNRYNRYGGSFRIRLNIAIPPISLFLNFFENWMTLIQRRFIWLEGLFVE